MGCAPVGAKRPDDAARGTPITHAAAAAVRAVLALRTADTSALRSAVTAHADRAAVRIPGVYVRAVALVLIYLRTAGHPAE